MRLFLLTVLALGLAITDASALDITACQVRVPRGEVGVLQNDVSCAAAFDGGPQNAIILERNAVLDLNGFTLDHYSVKLFAGVYCEGRCEVRGPGRLVSSNLNAGVASFAHSPVVVSNVDFSGQITGVHTPFAKTTLTNVTIAARDRGAEIARLIVDGVAITVDATGAHCIDTSNSSASWVRGKDVTLAGCDVGIGDQGSIDVANLTVTGMRTAGVFARKKLRLVDSSVTGNPVDLISRKKPTLLNTACDTSAVWAKGMLTGASFGVCAND
jgi:hypothetical protein